MLLPTPPITKENAESTLTSIRWLRDGMLVAWAGAVFMGVSIILSAVDVDSQAMLYVGVGVLGGLAGLVGYRYGKIAERYDLWDALTHKVRNPD